MAANSFDLFGGQNSGGDALQYNLDGTSFK